MYQHIKLKMLTHCKLYTNSCRRNLDTAQAKQLKFEIETTPDLLVNIAIYEQQDPAATLYLTTLD